jgi:hypothetical protein
LAAAGPASGAVPRTRRAHAEPGGRARLRLAAWPPLALALLRVCAATLAADAGSRVRLIDLSVGTDPDHTGWGVLAAASRGVDARVRSAALAQPPRTVAWLGRASLDAAARMHRRLRSALSAADFDGFVVFAAVAEHGPLPCYASEATRARRAGWCHVQYSADASARHAVHVLERLTH